MVKGEDAAAAAAAAAAASPAAAADAAAGGRKKRKASVKKEASSGEEEAYKPGAESSSEDFEAEASEEDASGSDFSDGVAAKKAKKGSAKAGAKKKAKKADSAYEEPPSPVPKAAAVAAKAAAKAAAKKAELAEGGPTFACRMAGVTDADWADAQARFADDTVKKLQALLRHNALATSGVNKADLAARCAEAALLGCLPACPACRAARLKFDADASKIAGDLVVTCPGHFSEDRANYFACAFMSPAAGIKRAAWRSLDEAAPPEEAAAEGAAAAAALIDDATAERIAALGDARAAADAVIAEVTRLKLSVPASGIPRPDVAAALLAHRDVATGAWDARKVLAVLAEKYPPAVSFDAGGEAGGAAGGGDASCRVSANAAMADAFTALASAAEDHWKRNTFNTAAKAIRLWPTAIVKGKELSDGPKKVKGVGASCAKLIDEFIKTGTIAPKV